MGCTSSTPAAAPSAKTVAVAKEQSKDTRQEIRDEDVSTTDESNTATNEIAPKSNDANTSGTDAAQEPVLWEWGEPEEDEEDDDRRAAPTQNQPQCPKCGSANSTLMEVTIGATHEGWGRSWNDCKYNCVKCNKALDPGMSADVCRKCKCFWHRNGQCDCEEDSVKKPDDAATNIQKHARGMLDRKHLQSQAAPAEQQKEVIAAQKLTVEENPLEMPHVMVTSEGAVKQKGWCCL